VGSPQVRPLTSLSRFLDPEFGWNEKYDAFQRLGSDIFLLVAPGANSLHVADPEVTIQIVTRRNDFPKPTKLYKSVDVFGKNVVSTEGSIWRHHRKITAPPFTEKNNHLVWTESLYQAQSMITSWIGSEGNDTRTISTLAADAMRLSLHVISRAGFGVRLKWPHEENASSDSEKDGEISSAKVPPGHTLAYKDALGTLLENIIWVFLFPRWLLQNSPLKMHKMAYNAYIEWGKYMNEMYHAKRAEVAKGGTTEGMDLMGKAATMLVGADNRESADSAS
jgi:cytochrome P450